MKKRSRFRSKKVPIHIGVLIFILLMNLLMFIASVFIGSGVLQDFTTFTKQDPNNHLTVYNSTCYKHHVVENEDCYLYNDYGTDALWYDLHAVEARIENISGLCDAYVLMLSNDLNDRKGLLDTNKNYSCIRFNSNGDLELEKAVSGSISKDSYTPAAILDKWWFFLFKWNITGLYLFIYNNTARTPDYLEATLSVSSGTTAFQYVIASNTRNRGDAANVDLLVKNLNLFCYVPEATIIGESTHQANVSCTFFSNWSAPDPESMSFFIFGSNISGSFQNDTATAFLTTWANASKVLPIDIGDKILWEIWANNTAGNWNNTGPQIFILVGINLTSYHSFGGYFLIEGVIRTNGSSLTYPNCTTIELLAIPLNASYIWENFTWNNQNSTENRLNVTILTSFEGYDFWAYFSIMPVTNIVPYVMSSLIIMGSIAFVFVAHKKRR